MVAQLMTGDSNMFRQRYIYFILIFDYLFSFDHLLTFAIIKNTPKINLLTVYFENACSEVYDDADYEYDIYSR